MQCFNCGKEIEEDSRFCRFCGAEIPQIPDTDADSLSPIPEISIQEEAIPEISTQEEAIPESSIPEEAIPEIPNPATKDSNEESWEDLIQEEDFDDSEEADDSKEQDVHYEDDEEDDDVSYVGRWSQRNAAHAAARRARIKWLVIGVVALIVVCLAMAIYLDSQNRSTDDAANSAATAASESSISTEETVAVEETESSSAEETESASEIETEITSEAETESVSESSTAETTSEPTTAAPEYAAIRMSNIEAVSSSTMLNDDGITYPATNLIDDSLSTAWAEGESGDGIGSTITFEFDGTYVVSTITIYNGYQKRDALYYANSRPKQITITGDSGEETIDLSDTTGAQTFTLSTPMTTNELTLTITDVYVGSSYRDTNISEIIFE